LAPNHFLLCLLFTAFYEYYLPLRTALNFVMKQRCFVALFLRLCCSTTLLRLNEYQIAMLAETENPSRRFLLGRALEPTHLVRF
jgi:hypothetical protein